MSTVNLNSSKAGFEKKTWWDVTAGTAMFVVWELVLILGEIPHDWQSYRLSNSLRNLLIVVVFLLPYLGLCLGWIQGFPHWSYPYVGMSFVLSLYMMQVATPGLVIFGAAIRGGALWGWRAWIAPILAVGIGLLVTRSLQPLSRFFTQGWENWSLFSYAIFGWMPLLILVAFDEMDRLYSLYFMVILTGIMLVTVIAYLIVRQSSRRTIWLALGSFCFVTVTVLGVESYWESDIRVGISRWVGMVALLLAVFFSPALVGLVHFLTVKFRSGQAPAS